MNWLSGFVSKVGNAVGLGGPGVVEYKKRSKLSIVVSNGNALDKKATGHINRG